MTAFKLSGEGKPLPLSEGRDNASPFFVFQEDVSLTALISIKRIPPPVSSIAFYQHGNTLQENNLPAQDKRQNILKQSLRSSRQPYYTIPSAERKKKITIHFFSTRTTANMYTASTASCSTTSFSIPSFSARILATVAAANRSLTHLFDKAVPKRRHYYRLLDPATANPLATDEDYENQRARLAFRGQDGGAQSRERGVQREEDEDSWAMGRRTGLGRRRKGKMGMADGEWEFVDGEDVRREMAEGWVADAGERMERRGGAARAVWV